MLQLVFVFLLFLGMVMCANEFETKEKQKLTQIRNYLQHVSVIESNISNIFTGFANFIDEWSRCDFCFTNFGVIL